MAPPHLTDDRVATGACRVLLVPGSLRRGSTTTAALLTVQAVAPPGVDVTLYEGMAELPPFDPDLDRDPLPGPVAGLRAALHRTDAVLICTPEYAGALPGPFVNLLDWTIGDADEGSIYRKPVAWVNASASPTGAADAHASLRTVLAYAHAEVVDAACRRIPVARSAMGEDGRISDPAVRAELAEVLVTLVAALR